MWLSMDSNPAWATMMSSLLGSKSEVTIQPNSINGVVNTNGVNVYGVSGSKFDPNWIGKRIYINNVLYTISLINSSTTLTLTTSAGTQNNVAYQKVAVLYKSVVNTNETIVTWVSGMLFPYWWVGQTVSINGTNYTVNSVSTDGKTLTLTTTAGIKTNASLFKEESNLDCANIGINKQSGTNEERLVIVAKATGEYRIATVATGIGKHYPLFFDVGGQNAMSIDTNRNVTISNSGNAQLNISGALGGGRNYYHISKTTGEYVIYNDVSGDIFIIDVSGRVNFKKPPVLPTYNKASLPVATAVGSMIYVNDDIGGAVVAFADGSVWRRVTDRAVIA
jgi:hypothetical protein